MEGRGCDCESGGDVAMFSQPMQRHRDVHSTPDYTKRGEERERGVRAKINKLIQQIDKYTEVAYMYMYMC